MAKTRRFLLHVLVSLMVISTFTCYATDSEDLEVEVDERNGDDAEDSENPLVEDSVLVLNGDNFDETVDKNPTLLVEFYAPWCGHCKQLAPEYAAAAKELAENDPPVTLGKVDATVHNELGQRFEVQGYPTLIFFKNGKQHAYDGPRSKDGIVKYMKERASPDWEPEPESVVTLTEEDFDEVVDNEELMLVEFYAPWCGHCKKLAPIYEKAAKTLKQKDPPIMLAKVDATKDAKLGSRFGITGYPTLKLFRKGKAFDYRGGRDSEYDFVYYMENQIGDGAKEITSVKQLKEFFPIDDVSVVGFFESHENPLVAPYKEVSDEIREDYSFGIVFDEAVRKAYKVNPNSLVVFNPERFYTKYEPKWHVMEIKSDTTGKEVKEFIKKYELPLVGHYSTELKKRYDTRKPLCLVFYTVNFDFEYRKATQLWRNKIADIAKKYPDITFAVADEESNAELVKDFGLDESSEELNIGLIGKDGKKYGMEPMEEYDSDEIIEFLNKYRMGRLTPHIRSQRAPKKQTGPVTVVVGKTFKDIVLDPKKDVLIELYAPWCGHCKKLEPVYSALAKKLKNEKNLVIAKMDATGNDSPDNFSAAGYPTIYFAPANAKDSPIKYEENARDVESFEKFLKEHATVSFGKNAKEEL